LTHPLETNFEIGRFLHIKSEIRKLKSDSGDVLRPIRSAISDFGFDVQESSNIKILFAGVMDGPSMLLP